MSHVDTKIIKNSSCHGTWSSVIHILGHTNVGFVYNYSLCLVGRDLEVVSKMSPKFGSQPYLTTYGVNNSLFKQSPIASDR